MTLSIFLTEFFCPDCQCSFYANRMKENIGRGKTNHNSAHSEDKIACNHCGLNMPVKWFKEQHQKCLEMD